VVASPSVPGLVLDRRLGSGDHGEVWRALDLGTVGPVAVLVGAPAARAGAAAREAALLRRIDHPNVVRLHSVIDLADGRRALVTDLAEGGDLAQLVRRLGPLSVGEVVTLTIALARALEHVHALGFVHGRLTPHQVLFHSNGRPVLGGLGVASLMAGPADHGPPTYPSPADDVRSLGEIVRFASTGNAAAEVTQPFAALVAACTAPDPHSWPSPTRVAAMAWEAARPSPVRLFADGTTVVSPRTTARPFEVPVTGVERPSFRWSSGEVTGGTRHGPSGGAGGEQHGGSAAGLRGDVRGDDRGSLRRGDDRGGLRRGDDRGGLRRGDDRGGLRRSDDRGGLRRGVRVGLPGWSAARAAVVGRGRRLALSGGVLAVIALCAAAAIVAGRGSTAPGRDSASAPSGETSPTYSGLPDAAAAVSTLAAARAQALAAPSPESFAAVDAPGSAALASDTAFVRRLHQSGVTLSGLSFSVTDASVITSGVSGGRPTVTVTAHVSASAYLQLRTDGSVLRRVPATPLRTVRLTLVRTTAGWRVLSDG